LNNPRRTLKRRDSDPEPLLFLGFSTPAVNASRVPSFSFGKLRSPFRLDLLCRSRLSTPPLVPQLTLPSSCLGLLIQFEGKGQGVVATAEAVRRTLPPALPPFLLRAQKCFFSVSSKISQLRLSPGEGECAWADAFACRLNFDFESLGFPLFRLEYAFMGTL